MKLQKIDGRQEGGITLGKPEKITKLSLTPVLNDEESYCIR